ncbi:hypothetical protein FQN55_000289 [Onygenales sp. PD_40]|nr:hypothetical protein FQN55_000289 [Onygenales sp. PD_40]KAK2787338.1 hypothetical protein FQN52_007242 [Onygenales sp. PD_12]KAK2801477.1 hypothetical protein FQN51_005371 [Onygenales sp. PD_10]
MLFHPAKLLLMAAALGTLLCTVASLDIVAFSQNSCQGNSAVCPGPRQRQCCQMPGSTRAQSARLRGGGSQDQLVVTRRRGGSDCGQIVAKGRGCISRGGRYDGAFWCRNCRIPDRAEGMAAAEAGVECTSTIEPSLLHIGDKWVAVNSTTPAVDKNKLFGLVDSDAGAEAIPKDLLKYVTAPPDLGAEEDMAEEDDQNDYD